MLYPGRLAAAVCQHVRSSTHGYTKHYSLLRLNSPIYFKNLEIKTRIVHLSQVTLGEGRGGPVATLRHSYRGRRSSVGIFLHAEGEEECEGLGPDIRVRGDLSGHAFRFLMGGRVVAQVHRRVLKVDGPTCAQVSARPRHAWRPTGHLHPTPSGLLYIRVVPACTYLRLP